MLLTACVLSIEPVVPESETVFDPALLGRWAVEGDKDTAVIRPAGETGYLIEYTDEEGRPGWFEGRLGRLGDHMLLELSPAGPESGASDAYKALMLPASLQFVVAIEGGSIHAAQLEIDSLRAALRRGDQWTPHLQNVAHTAGGNDHLVLTGTTNALRVWLREYLERPGVLGDTAVWRRVGSGG